MIEQTFQHMLGVTDDPVAAAVLTLAHVISQPADQLLTVKQAAQRLGVSAKKVYALCDAGSLCHQKIGRVIRIAPADLGAVVEKQDDRMTILRSKHFG